MITVYGYVPAWGLPDISPYVTKLVNYLTFTGQEFDYRNQDLATLGTDSPTAKLPYIVDGDGTKVNDSTRIIQSDFLGGKPYFMGDTLRSVDATIYSTFRHVADVPWDWAGRDYAHSKANLTAYADRLRDEFKV